MWVYEKKLLHPIKVSKTNPKMAKYLFEQYGGSDGELASSLRYLNQRYTMPNQVIALINDLAMEELNHLELVGTMIYQLTKDCDPLTMEDNGLASHYIRYENSLFYADSSGNPFSTLCIHSKGDPIADLYDNISSEERARATNQWLINLSDDPDLNDGLRFLREREIIHATRLHEAIELLKEEQTHKTIF